MAHSDKARLARSQRLLSEGRAKAWFELERHRRALLAIANKFGNVGDPQWLENATKVLREAHRIDRQIKKLDARLADLAKLIGPLPRPPPDKPPPKR